MAKAKVSVAKRVHVSAEDFVRAALNATNHAEIAAQTGLKVTSVATRLATLRKKGVNVPNFKRGGGGARKLDVAALNAMIEASA